jgi:HEAT repeat protein
VNLDTKWRRARVNKQLQEFSERLKNNPNDQQALSKLIAALNGSYRFGRSAAAGFLGNAGAAASGAVPDLASALRSNERFLSSQAAEALGRIGPGARGVIPDLIGALKLGNCSTSWNAAETLGIIGAEPDTVVPALIACLDVHNLDQLSGASGYQLAFVAADSLAKFGSEARQALPALKSRLHHPQPQFRLHVACAILVIDPSDSEPVDVLTDLFTNNIYGSVSLTAVSKLGSSAKAAIPAVEAYLQRELSDSQRQHGLYTLKMISGSNVSAVLPRAN